MSHLRVSSAGLLARVYGESFRQVCHGHNSQIFQTLLCTYSSSVHAWVLTALWYSHSCDCVCGVEGQWYLWQLCGLSFALIRCLLSPHLRGHHRQVAGTMRFFPVHRLTNVGVISTTHHGCVILTVCWRRNSVSYTRSLHSLILLTYMVATYLKNLDMSQYLTALREILGKLWGKIYVIN